MSEGLSNEIINDYFMLTLYEIEKGTLYSEIEMMLKEYEDREMYLECAGIKKAIDLSAFFTTNDLVRYMQNEQLLDDPRIQMTYGDEDK